MNQNVTRLERPFAIDLSLPGSKSITLRDCVLAALADGTSTLHSPGECDDYWRMKDSLCRLGVTVEDASATSITVRGTGGRFSGGPAELYLGQSATSTRLLMGMCLLRRAPTTFDAHESMRVRPNKLLVDALVQLGAQVSAREGGYLPLTIVGADRAGSRVRMKGDTSSQYFSALLQVAPLLPQGLTIDVDGELVSQPYVDVTLREMKKFGVTAINRDFQQFVVEPARYVAQDLTVEGDASGASYFAALATMHQSRVTLRNLGTSTVQGDFQFLKLCERLGARVTRHENTTEIVGPAGGVRRFGEPIDMESMPDVAPTLMVMAPFIPGPTRITGLATLRVKECDRIAAPATELRKLGVPVTEGPDWIEVGELPAGADTSRVVEIDTYHDHRIAMSFAVLGTLRGGLSIRDPGCVAKTYPRFWEELQRCYASH